MMSDESHTSLPPLPRPRADLAARIRSRIVPDEAASRGPSGPSRWLYGVAAVGAMLMAVAVMMGTQVASQPMRSSVVALGGLLLVAAATFIALVRSGSARVGVGARLALALLPGLAFLVLSWLAYGALPPVAVGDAHISMPACLVRGLVLASIPMAVLVVVWRRTDPFTPRLTGAIIGGWAGFTGTIGLTMACPSTDPLHIIIGHGAAIVGGALVGSLLGRRLLSP